MLHFDEIAIHVIKKEGPVKFFFDRNGFIPSLKLLLNSSSKISDVPISVESFASDFVNSLWKVTPKVYKVELYDKKEEKIILKHGEHMSKITKRLRDFGIIRIFLVSQKTRNSGRSRKSSSKSRSSSSSKSRKSSSKSRKNSRSSSSSPLTPVTPERVREIMSEYFPTPEAVKEVLKRRGFR
jgi:hypothetical protein